ncbi:hypothetical protein KUTeg_014936 [Tegillarca granosa]|uniref:Uncharacterized protein n=1 Tax=Tegillarca granosa TaxID=220873 RepID=A0ABQ9ETD4_TEGGR|nr:hypothetical protein KUTeg_014936 [Tegillarca granosa]
MTMAKEFRGNDVPPIVNNKNNGVDVDKWDYFIRDSHACGFPNNFDKERDLSVLRVRQYKKGTQEEASVLSFPLKDQINLYNMFNLRYTLHSKVYQHLVVKCVEEMIADVLKLADNSKILQSKPNQTILIEDSVSTKECRGNEALENYCLMDDRLLYLIYHAEDIGTKKYLQHAKRIMDRIHQRDFYQRIYKSPLESSEKKCLGKMIQKEKKIKEKEIADGIVKHLQKNPQNEEIGKEIEKLIQERDDLNIGGPFRISIMKVNYGNEDKNPIPNVYFYDKGGDSVIDYTEPEKSPMVPSKFEEVTLRVFCTLSRKDCDGVQLETQIKSYLDEFFRM